MAEIWTAQEESAQEEIIHIAVSTKNWNCVECDKSIQLQIFLNGAAIIPCAMQLLVSAGVVS